MITKSQLGVDQERYKELPQIPGSELKILWESSRYDGPLTGVMLYEGKKHYFAMQKESYVETDSPEYPERRRHFVLYALSDEQIHELTERHEEFREHVGTHCDYDETGRRCVGKTKSRSTWHFFYEKYEDQRMSFHDNEAVGWYDELDFLL